MSSPRIAIVGSNGLLGQNLARTLAKETRHTILCTGRRPHPLAPDEQPAYEQLDITDRAAVKEFALKNHPEIVINCAALSDVDACEIDRERAWKINVKGVEHLVSGCRAIDARLIHFSTDYVFDGNHPPYDEHNKPAPVCYYGKTKLASENVCRIGGVRYAIVRTSVLYGIGKGVRENFVQRIVNTLSRDETFKVVTDQSGNPTSAEELSNAVMHVIERRCEGVYHIAGPDIINRFAFACEVARIFDLNAKLILTVLTAELHQKAVRPVNAGLITLKAESQFGIRLSGVVEGLRQLKRQMLLAGSVVR